MHGNRLYGMSGRNGAKSFCAQQPSGSSLKERSDGIRLLIVSGGLKRLGRGRQGVSWRSSVCVHRVAFHVG
jgi:hypothetical protein